MNAREKGFFSVDESVHQIQMIYFAAAVHGNFVVVSAAAAAVVVDIQTKMSYSYDVEVDLSYYCCTL